MPNLGSGLGACCRVIIASCMDSLKGMKLLAERHRLPPILAVLLYQGASTPRQNDFLRPKGDLAKNIRLLQFLGNQLRKEQFSVADPFPLFKKYNKMALIVSEWDPHPNYLAHYLYAKSIITILNEKLRLLE